MVSLGRSSLRCGSLRASSWASRSVLVAVHRQHVRRSLNNKSGPSRDERIVFSGIQPTGTPHLGNLLGALFNWVELQRREPASTTLYFSIVGWHSLTVWQDPSSLRENRRDMLAALLAVGINPNRSVLFHQDDVPQHLELFWILACMTNMGKLNRMTTWKAKATQLRSQATRAGRGDSEDDSGAMDAPSDVGLGLLSYPVLQTADIILYGATHVPVGDDQRQHLELAREITKTFNSRYSSVEGRDSTTSDAASGSLQSEKIAPAFPLPKVILTPTARVSSLREPTSKMSKSCPDAASKILLSDDEASIRDKVKKAVTDSERRLTYDPAGRAGVANLLRISTALENWFNAKDQAASTMAIVTPEQVAERLNQEFGGGSEQLKAHCADLLVRVLSPLRSEYLRLRQDIRYLDKVEEQGRKAAVFRAAATMRRVKQLVGLADRAHD